jgi:type II secretory pathway pseudopilin PulG
MEVMVTVIVLGTGIVLLAQGLTAAIRSSAKVQRVTRAAVVADEIFQRMELGEIDFTTQSEGSLEDVGPEGGSSGAEEDEEVYRSVFRWYADVQMWEVEDVYRVALTVTWDDIGPETDRSWEFVRLFYVPPEDEEETSGP